MNDSYSNISADGMSDLVAAAKQAHRTLTDDLSDLSNRMRTYNVDRETLNKIDQIAEWIDNQIPGLERRRNLAEGLTGDLPDGTMIQISEPLSFASPEEAEQYGRELAQQLNESDVIDADTFDELMENFGPYVDDPDVMAGFYLELGPETTEILPSLLHSTGSENAPAYLEQFSIGLGTALSTTDNMSSTSDYYSELSDFRQHFREPVDHPGMAWDRLALLQSGDFPGGFVSDVVRNSVLDHFEGDDWDNTDFRGPITPKLGLPEDTLALAFGALGNNPTAARLALDGRSNISLEEYTERVYGLGDTIGTGDQIIEAYGQALASGSGAFEDPPDKGYHASNFAFEVIQVLGQHEDTPWGMREPMGQIAAAYAEELLVGSYAQSMGDRGASMDIPEGFDLPPGTDPAFLLSPEDVYRFLHGFAHDDTYSQDFDLAVAELFETLPSEALQADLETTQNNQRDPQNFEAVMSMFGTLSGLQHQAQLDVRGSDFEDSEARRERFVHVRNFFLGEAVGAGRVTGAAWKATQFFAPNALDNILGGDPDDPRDALAAEDLQMGVLQRYVIAEIMIDAGYPTSEDAPADMLDHDPQKILEDPDYAAEVLEDLTPWLENNSDGDPADHTFPFQDKYNNSWNALGNGRGDISDQIANGVQW
jgi:hypothetical protein